MTEADIFAETGVTLEVFSLDSLVADPDARIKDFSTLASYSWLDSANPEIIVPGAPFRYNGFRGQLKVSPDQDWAFVDQTSARLPSAPLLPIYAAVQHVSGGHDQNHHRIITDRGNLKKLLSWASSKVGKPFRIDLECNGHGGLVFRRWEAKTKEEFLSVRSYRQNFQVATCDPINGCEKMLSHSRIITYHFAGIPMLVRFECDGFIAARGSVQTTPSGIGLKNRSGQAPPLPPNVKTTIRTPHELAQELASVELSNRPQSVSTPGALSTASTLILRPYDGFEANHEDLMELKTRSLRSTAPLDAADIYSQAFWSQTPITIIAKHHAGRFQEQEELSLDFIEKQAGIDTDISKVGTLLKEILGIFADSEKGERACLVCEGGDLFLLEGGRGAGICETGKVTTR